MQYVIAKMGGIAVVSSVLALGCTGPVENKPLEKITTKETQILFSESKLLRSNSRTYIYMVQGISGQHKATGFTECLKTFDIELGKPYTVNLDYANNKIIIVNDLCEMTARLKARSTM